jgi:hypothetical protein
LPFLFPPNSPLRLIEHMYALIEFTRDCRFSFLSTPEDGNITEIAYPDMVDDDIYIDLTFKVGERIKIQPEGRPEDIQEQLDDPDESIDFTWNNMASSGLYSDCFKIID